MISRSWWTMVRPWWCPWVLPVMMVGSVWLVSRPALVVPWLAFCVLLGRVINAALARFEASLLASDRGLYFKNPS